MAHTIQVFLVALGIACTRAHPIVPASDNGAVPHSNTPSGNQLLDEETSKPLNQTPVYQTSYTLDVIVDGNTLVSNSTGNTSNSKVPTSPVSFDVPPSDFSRTPVKTTDYQDNEEGNWQNQLNAAGGTHIGHVTNIGHVTPQATAIVSGSRAYRRCFRKEKQRTSCSNSSIPSRLLDLLRVSSPLDDAVDIQTIAHALSILVAEERLAAGEHYDELRTILKIAVVEENVWSLSTRAFGLLPQDSPLLTHLRALRVYLHNTSRHLRHSRDVSCARNVTRTLGRVELHLRDARCLGGFLRCYVIETGTNLVPGLERKLDDLSRTVVISGEIKRCSQLIRRFREAAGFTKKTLDIVSNRAGLHRK